MNQVRLRFIYNEQDVLAGYRLHFKNTLRIKLTLLVSFLSIALGIFYLSFDSGVNVGYLLIIMPVVLIGILLFVMFVFPRILYKRQTKFNEPYSIIFSPEAILFSKAEKETQLDWRVYSRAVEDAHCYILYFGRNDFTIVPKRVFPSEEAEESFKKMALEHSLLY
jgi:hypothetical protein